MSAVSDAFERYKTERPLYIQLVELMKSRIGAACQEAGVPCTVTGRAKEIDSFVKKLIRKPQPYEDVYDKAGIRVVPVYPDDRGRVAAIVRATFAVTWSRDSLDETAVDRFTYRGLHLTAGLLDKDKDGVDPAVANLVAEVQVHTMAESLWASVNHDLVYKTEQAIPGDVQRSLHRLSALLELVDMGLGQARERILGQEGADEARFVAAIEKFFLRFNPKAYDPRLTVRVVKALGPLAGDPATFPKRIEAFVEANRERLGHVYEEYKSDFRHLLLSQPESILIFYLIDEDQVGLDGSWPEGVPRAALEGLQGVWVPSDP